MNSKLAKKIRKAFKDQGQDVTGPAELMVAKSTPRIVYVEDKQEDLEESLRIKGKLKAQTVQRLVIVNKTKMKYRQVKKAVMAQPKR